MRIEQARIMRYGDGARLMLKVVEMQPPPVGLDSVAGWSLDYAAHDPASSTANLCFSRPDFDATPRTAGQMVEVTLAEIEGILAGQA